MPLFAKAWKYYLLLKESLVSLFRWPQALKELPLCTRNKTKNLPKLIKRTHLYICHVKDVAEHSRSSHGSSGAISAYHHGVGVVPLCVKHHDVVGALQVIEW